MEVPGYTAVSSLRGIIPLLRDKVLNLLEQGSWPLFTNPRQSLYLGSIEVIPDGSPSQTIGQEFNGFATSYTLTKTLVKVWSLTGCGYVGALVVFMVVTSLSSVTSCPCQMFGPRGQEHKAAFSLNPHGWQALRKV